MWIPPKYDLSIHKIRDNYVIIKHSNGYETIGVYSRPEDALKVALEIGGSIYIGTILEIRELTIKNILINGGILHVSKVRENE